MLDRTSPRDGGTEGRKDGERERAENVITENSKGIIVTKFIQLCGIA